ncbi:hypothetical protein DPX16_23494 [Anabarilius grahami]|uniref:Uncharacterized protein n=1 Tax=Anabarilius grahami TaxID=495550 RepID=A0A3N0Z164_ANAGA|nr:hypothetical protein DPX16_23494 [Anabarilius grahami]
MARCCHLVCNAISTVVERFQESKKQAAAFQRFILLKSKSQGAAAKEQPHPYMASSSYRQAQKESVASRAPPAKPKAQKQHSQPKPQRERTDLRNVILSRRASGKRF